jgi:cysteine-rich repeat protein
VSYKTSTSAGASYAVAGTHFTHVAGKLTFLSTETVKSVEIPVHNIEGYGGNVSFLFTILDATSASISKATAVITIQNVHPPQPTAPKLANGGSQLGSLTIEWLPVVWADAVGVVLDSENSNAQSVTISAYDVQAAKVADDYSESNVNNGYIWTALSRTAGTMQSYRHGSLPSYAGYVYRIRAIATNSFASSWSDVSAVMRTLSVCGDGVRQGAEQCDVGDATENVGCAQCRVLPGYSCSGQAPDVCLPGCGDGKKLMRILSLCACITICVYVYWYVRMFLCVFWTCLGACSHNLCT